MYIEERLIKLEKENLDLKGRIEKLEEIVLVFGKEKAKEKARSSDVKKEKSPLEKIRENKIDKKLEMNSQEIFKKLKGVRAMLARSEGVRAYVIFNDKTMEEMAEKLPITEWEFLEIGGIGDKKLEKYGHIFIEAIKKIRNNEELDTEECVKVQKKVLRPATVIKDYILTHERYSDGYGLDEIARSRKISPYTAVRELIRCKEEGLDVDLGILIEGDTRKLIMESYKKAEETGKDLKELLPRGIKPYERMIALYGIK